MRPLVASLLFFLIFFFFFKKDYQLETATVNPCYISLLVFLVKKKSLKHALQCVCSFIWLDTCLLFNYTKSWCFNRRELLDPIAASTV